MANCAVCSKAVCQEWQLDYKGKPKLGVDGRKLKRPPCVRLSAPVVRPGLAVNRHRVTEPMPKAWNDARWALRKVKLAQGWRPKAGQVQMTPQEIAEFN